MGFSRNYLDVHAISGPGIGNAVILRRIRKLYDELYRPVLSCHLLVGLFDNFIFRIKSRGP